MRRSRQPHRSGREADHVQPPFKREGRPVRSGTNLRFFSPSSTGNKPPWDEEQGVDNASWEKSYQDRDSDQNRLESFDRRQCQILSTQHGEDEEGREVVTLITKDGIPSRQNALLEANQRWIHLRGENLAFGQFRKQVDRLSGLDSNYRRLTKNVLDRVAKLYEKGFVHGKFLEPMTVLGQGPDPNDDSNSGVRRVLFVCMPVFSLEPRGRHAYDRSSLGHPVRGLLQWQYRLESMADRDAKQVTAKSNPKSDKLVCISHVWALVIGKVTILTSSPLDFDALCRNTLEIRSYSVALQDKECWCVQLVDTEKSMFYLPLGSCQTFYELMHMIITRESNESDSTLRKLLDPRSKITLVDDHKHPVSPASWKATLKAFKGPLIRLKLVERLQAQGVPDEVQSDEDNDTDASSASDDDSDSSESHYSSPGGYTSSNPDSRRPSNVSESDLVSSSEQQLRKLYRELKTAELHGDHEGINSLKYKNIPKQEAHVVRLIAEDFDEYSTVPTRKGQLKHGRRFVNKTEWTVEQKLKMLEEEKEEKRKLDMIAMLVEEKRRLDVERSLANLREDNKGRYSQSQETTPDLQDRVTHPISVDSDGSSTVSKNKEADARAPSDSSSGRLVSGDNEPDDGRPQTEEAEFPEDAYKDRRPYISPRIFRRNRRAFEADEGFRNILRRRHDLSGLPYIEVDESRWCERDNRLPKHHDEGIYGDRIAWGHPRHHQRRRELPTDRDQEDIWYSPTRKRVIDTAYNLGFVERRPTTLEAKLDSQRDPANPHHPRTSGPGMRTVRTSSTVRSTPRRKSIDRMCQELLQGQGGSSEPMFIWPVGLKLRSTVISKPPDSLPKGTTELSTQGSSRPDFSGAPVVDQNGLSKSTSVHDDFRLRLVLEEINDDLESVKAEWAQNLAGKLLYKRAERKSMAEVKILLADSGVNVGELMKVGSATYANLGRTNQARLFETAKRLLIAFVPLDYDNIVVRKYWGAIYRLQQDEDHHHVELVLHRLLGVLRMLRDLHGGVLQADGKRQEHYQIPRAAPVVFKALLALLIFASTPAHSNYAQFQLSAAFKDCRKYVSESAKQLVLMSKEDQCQAEGSYDPVYGEGLLAIMLANLQDKLSPEGQTFYLTELYHDYAVKTQYSVSQKASVRVYEDIKFLREEIEVIKSVLTIQYETLCSLWDSLYIPEAERERIRYSGDEPLPSPSSLSHRVVDRMRYELQRRMEDFDELLSQADSVQNTAAQSISLRTETNDRAIVIFTVVTIVFLPLSFVSGFFGMNTKDIRNMGSNQSLFWAISVPFTALILSCALLAAYFERISHSLSQFSRGGSRKKLE